ncbi:MAG: CCA tRNA nucleotidyltransferase [Bryobacteraceae bacterium]
MNAPELARRIVKGLRSHGHRAYFVGGCVRDLLLKVNPKDYDIATDARPEEVERAFPGSLGVGAHFGVMLVRDGDEQVEVATFRSDHNYVDGRHPSEVLFETDPRKDVLRRDFTINALLMDPASGEVLDYVGGQEDLADGVIRAIGNPEERFREDHLRLLRAVRFAARLGFEIESVTEGAIIRLSPLILDVAAERNRDELVRILTEGAARRGFEMLFRTGLLQQLLPEVVAMRGVQQPPEYHPEGDVWTHTMIMLDGLRNPAPELALGVLLHDVGKPPTFRVADRIRFDGHVDAGVELTRGIMARFRFSNDEARQVEALVANHMRFMDTPRMKESTLKRFLRLPELDEHLELHRLDCSSSHGSLDNYDFVLEKRAEFGEEKIAPPRLVTGQDLIDAGYRAGVEFGRVLREVEDAQLEGRVTTKEEGLALAKRLMG